MIKVLIGATFLVPLVMVPSSFIFPFIVPKILLFRSLVMALLALFVVLFAVNWRSYVHTWKQPVSIAVGLFFLSLLLSTFIGVDWYRSFWDNHERMLGLFTITHYILLYFVATAVLKEKDWIHLLRFFLLSGAVVMGIALLQKINPQLLLNRGATRVTSTLGNTIYVAGYGLFLLFTGYWLYTKERIKGWRIYALVGSFSGLCGLFASGTRGAFIGLAAGLLVLLISYAIAFKENKKLRQSVLILLLLGVIVSGLLLIFRQTSFVQSIPAIGRLANTSISEGTASTRIKAWGIAVDAWKERPVFGWGPNNYYFAFNKYYRAEFLTHGWKETWFDNAHNIVMNTLAVQGVVGIVVYLGLFVVAILLLWRAFREQRLDGHTVSIASAFLVAHLVQNVFVFENPTSYLYFFFFLAFINHMVMPRREEATSDRHPSTGLLITASLIVLLCIYVFNINPAKANMSAFKTIQNIYRLQKDIPAQYAATVSIPTPHVDDIRNDVARIIGTSANTVLQSGNAEYAKELLTLGYDELEKNKSLHPLDIRVHLNQAQLAQQRTQLFNDPNGFIDAERILEEALTLSPERQQLQFLLSFVKLGLGKGDEAIALVEDARDNEPRVQEAWWRLAVLHQTLGDVPAAKEVIAEAEEAGIVFSAEGLQAIQRIKLLE